MPAEDLSLNDHFLLEITRRIEKDKERPQWRARVLSAHNRLELFKSSEGYNNQDDLLAITQRLFPGLTPGYPDETE